MKSKFIPNQKGKKGKRFAGTILEVFENKPGKPLNYKQISNSLGITSAHGRKTIIEQLMRMCANKQLKEVDRGKYVLVQESKLMIGTIDFAASGTGFVTLEDNPDDVFIHRSNTGNALPKDTVEIRITRNGRGKRSEGKVMQVVKRHQQNFVGIIEMAPSYAFVVSDNVRVPVDFFVPLDKVNGAKDGEKVVIKFTGWDDPKQSPYAEVIERLGMPGENNVEMLSILASNGFLTTFPRKVINEAESISFDIPEAEIATRKDYRKVTTFTIDPHDAKDFDDALSFQKLPNGNIEVGVHIADVTHYVKPGSALDMEAYNRATSVYLVDRVIPMLPEHLSNGVCSLRPNEDKLCFSTTFEFNSKGNLVNTWIGRTVIHSDKRFAYEDAQEIIETGNGEFSEEILKLNELAQAFRAKRMTSGSISFDKIEVRIKLDENNNPDGVYLKQQKEANKLIEEFMLLANQAVALYVSKLKQPNPYVYRIHDEPDPTKVATFGEFIKQFGYSLNQQNLQNSLNGLLADVKEKPEAGMVETLAIRTMAKAVYSTNNIGHYGLGFSHYSHFTSPIRRYPDILAHRLLWDYLTEKPLTYHNELEELCKHCSAMERSATDAERESIKYFQALMLNDKVGEVFDGIISGVNDFGIFVELVENKCEGLIKIAELDGDYFVFDEKNYRVIGNNTGKVYQIGQAITVLVRAVNLDRKQIDFIVAPEY